MEGGASVHLTGLGCELDQIDYCMKVLNFLASLLGKNYASLYLELLEKMQSVLCV